MISQTTNDVPNLLYPKRFKYFWYLFRHLGQLYIVLEVNGNNVIITSFINTPKKKKKKKCLFSTEQENRTGYRKLRKKTKHVKYTVYLCILTHFQSKSKLK